jgi:hypothetical protein
VDAEKKRREREREPVLYSSFYNARGPAGPSWPSLAPIQFRGHDSVDAEKKRRQRERERACTVLV